MQLLLIENDDDRIRRLEMALEASGYNVDCALGLQDGELRALAIPYDVIIVADAPPQQAGPHIVRRLREHDVHCPILMTSATRAVAHRVAAFDAGADDYLTRPVALDELLARLRALRRRMQRVANQQSRLQAGPLIINRQARTASWAGTPLTLRPKEYELLALLVARANRLIPRRTIANIVWPAAVTDDTINTTVSGLRSVLRGVDSASAGIRIETIRGVGYQLITAEPVPARFPSRARQP